MTKLKTIIPTPKQLIFHGLWFVSLIASLSLVVVYSQYSDATTQSLTQTNAQAAQLEKDLNDYSSQLASVSAALTDLQSQDQLLINQELSQRIGDIEKTYKQSIKIYEELIKLREQTTKTADFDQAYVQSIVMLSEHAYASASTQLTQLSIDIASEKAKIAAAQAPAIPASVPVNNTPPGSGYARQQVATSIGNYLVSIVSADLGSTRVIVDTASDSTCTNNCPVMPLADFVTRNGGFAGVNGSYFCPASYPSCAGKTNSFDTLIMNKNKVYFNSDNNVYSQVPLVVFSGSSARFIGKSQDWGRDTGVDGVIANQPLLVSGGNVVFGGDGDPKKGSKSHRGFVGASGSTVYVGVVHSATVAEVAIVLKELGIQHALNLDGGGSTALYSSGYKVGPGRNLPNAIVLVRK